MKQYFTKVTSDYWIPKNKLCEEAQNIARDLERRLVPEDDYEEFITDFWNKIQNANIFYHRCKPLKLEWQKGEPYSSDGEIYCYISGVFHFSFYLVKE